MRPPPHYVERIVDGEEGAAMVGFSPKDLK
jgi:hypothetical protein